MGKTNNDIRLASGPASPETADTIDIALLAQAFLRNPHRVFPIEYEGRRLWVKRVRKNLPNPAAALIYHAVRIVLRRDEAAEAEHEIKSLMALRRHGFTAPEVVFRNPHYFVLSDIGPSLEAALHLGDATERERIVRLAGEALRKLHDCGRWHGAARVHNMTLAPDGGIGFIDLENRVDTWLPLPARKIWDLWQLGHSAAFFEPHVPLAEAALRAYGPGAVRRALYGLAVLSFGTYAALYPFRTTGKREIRQTHACIRAIYRAPRKAAGG
ncbi:MAG: phosphotransferase [Pseudorhodoplanes sp.]|nr:phosphotransferase [Pseudorhodoplanes sp.]